MIRFEDVENTFKKFDQIEIHKNQFFYKTPNKDLKLELGIFGEKKTPCIGIIINEKFDNFEICKKFRFLTLKNTPLMNGQNQKLLIILEDLEKFDVFKKFSKWMYQDLYENNTLLSSMNDLINYINQFSELFERSSFQKLSYNKILGLFGELKVLKLLLKSKDSDMYSVIDSWSGYRQSTFDFYLNNFSIEVKSSIFNNTNIHCSSSKQVTKDGNNVTLLAHLNFIEDNQSNNSEDIFDLIQDIKETILSKHIT